MLYSNENIIYCWNGCNVLVGGGIISHTVPLLHHFTEETVDHLELIQSFGSIIGALTPTLINLGIGFIAGAVVLIVVMLIQNFVKKHLHK